MQRRKNDITLLQAYNPLNFYHVMPYRRLPNTDQARLRALRTLLERGSKSVPFNLPFAQKKFLEIQAFLPLFDQAVNQYKQSYDRQASCGKILAENFKISKLYVSHFIQVLNFCIVRNEIKSDVRLLFGLNVDEKAVPEITTEQQLIILGDKVIKGEEKRGAMGGTRIYNPSIAMVKVKYEKFIESYNNHKNLLVTTQKYHDKMVEIREQADTIILNAWNEIEEYYRELEPDDKRCKCSDLGIVYLLRSTER